MTTVPKALTGTFPNRQLPMQGKVPVWNHWASSHWENAPIFRTRNWYLSQGLVKTKDLAYYLCRKELTKANTMNTECCQNTSRNVRSLEGMSTARQKTASRKITQWIRKLKPLKKQSSLNQKNYISLKVTALERRLYISSIIHINITFCVRLLYQGYYKFPRHNTFCFFERWYKCSVRVKLRWQATEIIKCRISGNNIHQLFQTGFVPTKAAELLTLCRQTPLPCVTFPQRAQKPHRVWRWLQSDTVSWKPSLSISRCEVLLLHHAPFNRLLIVSSH